MEVGWHLRLTREDALVFLVQPKLAPNVEDAVFIAGGWLLEWGRDHETCAAHGVEASGDLDEPGAPGNAGALDVRKTSGTSGEPGDVGGRKAPEQPGEFGQAGTLRGTGEFGAPGALDAPGASCGAGGFGEPGEARAEPAGGQGGWLVATVRRKAREG